MRRMSIPAAVESAPAGRCREGVDFTRRSFEGQQPLLPVAAG